MEVASVGESLVEGWIELEKTDTVVVGILTFTEKRVDCLGISSKGGGEQAMFISGTGDAGTQYTTVTFPEYKGYSRSTRAIPFFPYQNRSGKLF